jgi:hypothetical protein
LTEAARKLEKANASGQKARMNKYMARNPQNRPRWQDILDHADSSGVPVLVGDVEAMKIKRVKTSHAWR